MNINAATTEDAATKATAQIAIPSPETGRKSLRIKLFGIGNAGIRVAEHLISNGLSSTPCVAVNTDAQSLAASKAQEKIDLEMKLLRGLGTGGDPERGRAAAEENLPRLKAICEGAEVIFVVAGLGGGAGTGISPVLARAGKEAGALVLAFVTMPFECEGSRRKILAAEGLAKLKGAADGVICLANQKVFKLIDENTSVQETFKITDQWLSDGAGGVLRLLTCPGLIQLHLPDLCAMIRHRRLESSLATAEAMGPARSREVVEKLLAHPLLDGGQVLAEAEAVLISLMAGPDLTMAEVNRLVEQISRHCQRAQVVMGTAIDEGFRERLAVTVIVSRKNELEAEEQRNTDRRVEALDTQLLDRSTPARPASRFVAPAPATLPEDQVKEILARQPAGASRKSAARNPSKLRQTQLPLEIVSKGRFDKSEPTIHRGEDLDVPTYIRRGVALN